MAPDRQRANRRARGLNCYAADAPRRNLPNQRRGPLHCLTTPTVSGLSPSSGPESGGTTVTISGHNLDGATDGFGEHGAPAPKAGDIRCCGNCRDFQGFIHMGRYNHPARSRLSAAAPRRRTFEVTFKRRQQVAPASADAHVEAIVEIPLPASLTVGPAGLCLTCRHARRASGAVLVTVEEVLPQDVEGTSEVAKKITKSGLEMADRLVHTQHDLLRKVIGCLAGEHPRRSKPTAAE
jgi:hypothetical protein